MSTRIPGRLFATLVSYSHRQDRIAYVDRGMKRCVLCCVCLNQRGPRGSEYSKEGDRQWPRHTGGCSEQRDLYENRP